MHTARLSPRTPFLGRVDIVPHTGSERLSVWGQDVSETGMFLQTTQPFSVGDSVSVRFECDGLSVHVRAATVVWVRRFEPVNVDGRSPGIGIRFVSIDPPARAALRRLTATTKQAANDTPVPAHVTSSPPSTVLPPPALTLPPLSRSIIEAAGGGRARDLEDTQDLLPPSSLPRHTQEAISLPPLQFTQVPTPAARAPIVDDNLTSESRVFDGVPAAPRAVTMAPRLRSKPPTQVPTLSMTTSIVAPSAVLHSLPPKDRNITQPMHSLPPADAVDVFAGWTFKKADVVAKAVVEPAHSTIDTEIPHAADDVELQTPSLLPAGTSSRDEVQTMPPVDASVLQALQARMASERSVVPQPANQTIINPSILMAHTLPPSSLDDSFNSELDAERIDAGLDTSLDDDAALAAFSAAERSGAYTLGALPVSLPPKRTSSLPSQVPSSSSSSSSSSTSGRRTFQVAAALLVAGCAAGGAVGVLQHLARAPVPASSSTTVAVSTSAVAPAAPAAAVLPVADAEAELFGRQPQKAAVPEHVAVPESVAVAAAAVVEPAKVEAPKAVDKTADKAAEKVAGKSVEKPAEPVHVAAVKPTKKAPLVARPGRLEVDLPEGGRVKTVFALASPARVVVDLEQARLPQNTVTVDDGGTREVRFGKREGGTQRVVIVLGTDDKPGTVDARLEGDRLIASWKR